jgi:hypothetical protein
MGAVDQFALLGSRRDGLPDLRIADLAQPDAPGFLVQRRGGKHRLPLAQLVGGIGDGAACRAIALQFDGGAVVVAGGYALGLFDHCQPRLWPEPGLAAVSRQSATSAAGSAATLACRVSSAAICFSAALASSRDVPRSASAASISALRVLKARHDSSATRP